MKQVPLFFSSANDALTYTVQACGGWKAAGHRLRGDKSPDAAGEWLRACLNESRAERLSPEQVEALARIGRENDCHAYMSYMASTLGYEAPIAKTPEAIQHATLIEGVKAMTQVHALVESLQKQGLSLETLIKGVK